MFTHLTTLVILLWTLSSPYMSFLIWWAQNWTQHWCFPTSAEYRGKITALVLLTTPFLIQPWSHWPAWPPGHTAGSCPACCPSVHPGPFLPGRCPATLSPAWSAAGVVVPKVQNLAPGLVKSHLVGFWPWIQPVRSLCRALQQINTLSQLGVNTVP